MATERSVQRIWHREKSGLLVPGGTDSRLSESSSRPYLQIKDRAKAVEQLYEVSAVELPRTCELAGLINDAKALSDSWLTSGAQDLPVMVLYRACLLDRIAEAVLPLSRVAERAKYLTALTSDSLDLFGRQRSKAKDILWELELWSMLLRHSFQATLAEPPDIVISFENSKIGIACKKFYSERHVQHVLSEAVGQIEAAFDFGIVALNLDDLAPANQPYPVQTEAGMVQLLNGLNARFLRVHERHLRKYLASGRLLSAFVSTAAVMDILDGQPRINNSRQSTFWAIPGLPAEKDRQLKRFYDRLMA